MRYAIIKAYLGHLEEHNSSETNKSKSKFTPRPRDIKILARFYNKYVAKQEYFAYTYNTANTAITANTALIPRLECKTFVDKTFVGKAFENMTCVMMLLKKSYPFETKLLFMHIHILL